MTDDKARAETQTTHSGIDEAALGAYLRHHVAGSDAAEGMARTLLDREVDRDVRSFLEGFIDSLATERAFVITAIDQLDEGPGILERGMGMATGLATKIMDAVPSGAPSDLESLEALALGVWGKRLLWGTLKTVADLDERFRALPLDELSDQADDQERELVRLRQGAIIAAVIGHPED
jgi:hypothetical protein